MSKIQQDVKLITVHSGYNPQNDYCWITPVMTPLSADRKTIMMQMRMCEIHKTGRWDIFSQPYRLMSYDSGEHWTEPVVERGLEDIVSANQRFVFYGNPKLHNSTNKILSISNRVCYKNGILSYHPSRLFYSIFRPGSDDWTTPLEIQGLNIAESIYYNGGMQRVDLLNGDLLLPVYARLSCDSTYRSYVLRLHFDGTSLHFIGASEPLSIDVGRGACEPSLIQFNERFYITIRNDEHGYVAASEDGMQYSPLRRWRFDDGVDLGSYNTQQHWLIVNNNLFLSYTRRGANNEHLACVRHRAPLFMAMVDTKKLCVLKETEQIIMPERGAKLGNFDVVNIDNRESWVCDSEWMEEWPDLLVSRNYGSDNSVFFARIT